MPTNLSDADKVQRITSFIQQNHDPSWTDQQSQKLLNSCRSAVNVSDAYVSGNGVMAVNAEGMGAVIKINGVDIFGVNTSTTINQTHYGSGDNIAGDKYGR